MSVFDKSLCLSYLGLPDDYTPSPDSQTLDFLRKHMKQLPPHLLLHFSHIISVKQRTNLPIIRNRRLRYTTMNPPELNFDTAKNTWAYLWSAQTGRERWGAEEAEEEREWFRTGFLEGSNSVRHVGNLGNLLGNYEEEREAEHIRTLRRERAPVADQFIPEEDESSDDEEQVDHSIVNDSYVEGPEETRASFERLIREQLIYGLLEPFEYDKIDWDESLDEEDEREIEDRWFDDE